MVGSGFLLARSNCLGRGGPGERRMEVKDVGSLNMCSVPRVSLSHLLNLIVGPLLASFLGGSVAVEEL